MAQAAIPTTQSPQPFQVDAAKLRTDLSIRRLGRWITRLTPWFGYGFLWVPILILIVFSFNASRQNAVWRGFTLDWYRVVFGLQIDNADNSGAFSSTGLINAVSVSIQVAVATTILSTLLGTTAAIGLERYRFRGRRLIDLLIYLPVVIPEITMGLSLQLFFSAVFQNMKAVAGDQIPGFNPTLSIWTVIIGHVVFAMPFVSITVRARMAGMSKSLEEAARDLGANEWMVMRRITLPLLMPGILAGALLAMTLSLDDYVVTFFLAGPGGTTLPVFVAGMIRFGVNPTINAISTLVVIASMSLVLLSLVLQRTRD